MEDGPHVSHGTAHHDLQAAELSIPEHHKWNRIPMIAGSVGAVGAIASFLLGQGDPRQFYFSWLVAFLFFLSLALGSLFFVLALFLTKAGWAIVIRRVAENSMATLPLFALLFLPVLFGMEHLYHWALGETVEADSLLRWKRPFLNVTFFTVRAAIYLVSWSVISLWFLRSSCRQDRSGEQGITRRLQIASAPAMVVFALTVTFASVDWIMSLDPHWYSTIFGVYFFSGSLVGAFAFLAVTITAMRGMGLLTRVVSVEHFHDLGKLLFAFVAFWSYIGFSQYFLIWYANIPEETVWYAHRQVGTWRWVTILLVFGHFLVPFFFLLPRAVKRRSGFLLMGAGWLLLMHFVDIHWLVMPTLHHRGVHVGLLDVTTLLAVGGAFLAAFGWLTRRAALLPIKDPRLPESLGFENA